MYKIDLKRFYIAFEDNFALVIDSLTNKIMATYPKHEAHYAMIKTVDLNGEG